MNDFTVVRPSAFHSPARKTRLLLASLPIFAGLLSEDGTVLECNFAPLGAPLNSRTDWIGRPFETGPWWAYSEESQADIMIMLGRAKRGERSSKERLYQRADGKMGVMLLTLIPLFAPYGQADAILVTAVDVTERRQAENTSFHLAYDMAHRLRNSFTIMRALATRSATSDSGPALSRRLSAIREAHRLTYHYLFFDVPAQDIVSHAITDPDQISRHEYDPVSIPSDHVETLILALGELAEAGRTAELFTQKQADTHISLDWTETAKRPDSDMPSGLALALIKQIPEGKTGGTVKLSNDHSGFSWRFDIPLEHPDLARSAEDENPLPA